jgi:hypothetical protein
MTAQRWSLGVFGDLLWDHMPELRPGIREQVLERLRLAIVLEEEPQAPEVGDYVYAISEAYEAIEHDRAAPGVLEHLVDFLWAVLRYSGPEHLAPCPDLR